MNYLRPNLSYIVLYPLNSGLRLFFLSNFPEATFIQGATSIPIRTHNFLRCKIIQMQL